MGRVRNEETTHTWIQFESRLNERRLHWFIRKYFKSKTFLVVPLITLTPNIQVVNEGFIFCLKLGMHCTTLARFWPHLWAARLIVESGWIPALSGGVCRTVYTTAHLLLNGRRTAGWMSDMSEISVGRLTLSHQCWFNNIRAFFSGCACPKWRQQTEQQGKK